MDWSQNFRFNFYFFSTHTHEFQFTFCDLWWWWWWCWCRQHIKNHHHCRVVCLYVFVLFSLLFGSEIFFSFFFFTTTFDDDNDDDVDSGHKCAIIFAFISFRVKWKNSVFFYLGWWQWIGVWWQQFFSFRWFFLQSRFIFWFNTAFTFGRFSQLMSVQEKKNGPIFFSISISVPKILSIPNRNVNIFHFQWYE